MVKPIKDAMEHAGGPASGDSIITELRLSAEICEAVDKWASRQDGHPARSQAISQLIEVGLKAVTTAQSLPEVEQRGTLASAMAAQQIDKMGDASATADEQERRKQRLTQGPPEFRDERFDRPDTE